MPSKDFLMKHELTYETRLPTNMEPTLIDHLVKLGKLDSSKIHRVNYSAVAHAADLNES